MDYAPEAITLSPAFKDFISGAVAGAFAITVSQPLDTVRVRLQQAAHSSGPARNALGVLLTMVRKEGVLSPFKGLTYPLLFASFQSAILFQAYGWTLRQLASADQPLEQQRSELGQQLFQQQQEQRPRLHPHAQSQPSHSGTSPGSPTATHLATGGTTCTLSPSTSACPASAAAPIPLPTAAATQSSPATALHQLHLHHHHHLQDQQASWVHGSQSVSGQVLAWVAARLAGPAGDPSMLPSSSLRAAAGGASAPECTSCSINSSSRTAPGAVERLVGSDVAAADSSSSSRGSICNGGDSCEVRMTSEQRQQQQAPLPTPWHGFLAGSVSGFAQVFLWSPVELLKLRAQLQTATPGSAGYRNPAALATQVLRQDGVAGLYRGFTLTVIRDVPSYAMYFWLYHDIAGALSPGVHPEQAPPSTQVVAGGMAGVIAWLPIYPLDVLKSRVQAVPASASKGRNWMHFAREMYKEAGVRAFFRGVAPTLLRAFMMDGASFLGYTTTLKLLGGSGGAAAAEGSASPPAAQVPASAAAAAAPA